MGKPYSGPDPVIFSRGNNKNNECEMMNKPRYKVGGFRC